MLEGLAFAHWRHLDDSALVVTLSELGEWLHGLVNQPQVLTVFAFGVKGFRPQDLRLVVLGVKELSGQLPAQIVARKL